MHPFKLYYSRIVLFVFQLISSPKFEENITNLYDFSHALWALRSECYVSSLVPLADQITTPFCPQSNCEAYVRKLCVVIYGSGKKVSGNLYVNY